jgi:hypothetical protein
VNLLGILTALQNLPLAAAVRGETAGTEWLFPIIETCHVLCVATVFGSIGFLDLRLLGVAGRDTPVAQQSAETLPFTWTAWVLAALTGTTMFISKALTYYGNFQFRMKFLFMMLAAVNMLVFQFGVYRRVSEWNTTAPPLPARVAGGLSLAFWIAVIFFGRWVGFTT